MKPTINFLLQGKIDDGEGGGGVFILPDTLTPTNIQL